MQKITPFLWFDSEAEEAARFYVSLFKHSKILRTLRYTAAGPGKPGSVMTVAFRIAGQEFTALNGGPVFKFSPAISFVIHCASQHEVDTLWRKLARGGAIQQCGWLTDKYGVSWQVVPVAALAMLADKDPVKVERVVRAIYKMRKLDLKKLERAYRGK